MNLKITGSGCYIPKNTITNRDFLKHAFYNADGTPINNPNAVVIEKFEAITGIKERRYLKQEYSSSDLGFFAAEKAIENATINKENIDYIIVAHNFGDVKHESHKTDVLPCLAARIKHKLQIKNPQCVAYDLLFGCPGWIEGMIQAQAFIKSGLAKTCLVIGTETLSRVVDKHDRDAMIFADGAGATIVEATNTKQSGLLTHSTLSFTQEEAYYLYSGKTYNSEVTDSNNYIKMQGRKIYEFALTHVPKAMKSCLDASGVAITDVKKILIHQANEKMDEAIVNRFYRLYKAQVPDNIMPMSIHKLGNSSVATVPTLFDLIKNNKIENQSFKKGDIIIFASVGAGMHINAMVYKY